MGIAFIIIFMNSNNKLIAIIFGLSIFAILGGSLFFSSKTKTNTNLVELSEPTTYEYYWGNGCPHCAKVEEFLENWDKKDLVEITKYETWYNKENELRLKSRATTCNIPLQQVGVPLLVTKSGECIIGDVPIIEHFESLTFE